MTKSDSLNTIMNAAPVIPVVVVDDPAVAVKLAEALVKGGLPAIEITLRTPNAIDCIRAVSEEVEGAVSGAGTVLDAGQMAALEKAGAKFMVSPGVSPEMLRAAADCPVPLLPGSATASEMMALGEAGYTHLKFFPAEAAGGAAFLKSLASPLPQFSICPTGGITLQIAANYLALPNVPCVGGSWVAPSGLMAKGDWATIEALAREAAALKTA